MDDSVLELAAMAGDGRLTSLRVADARDANTGEAAVLITYRTTAQQLNDPPVVMALTPPAALSLARQLVDAARRCGR